MIAHSFIRPLPGLSQIAPLLDLDTAARQPELYPSSHSDANKRNWLRSLGRGKEGNEPHMWASADAPVGELVEAPAVIGAAATWEPEPEPEPPQALPEPFADAAAVVVAAEGEPEAEPLTPRAGWCILEEPATPDRVGRVRAGSSDEFKPDAPVRSCVPRSSTVEANGRQHTVYSVELSCSCPRAGTAVPWRWSVERRYSEFAELHESLAESLARQSDVLLPAVPPSRWVGLMDPIFVSERREALGAWLATMLSTAELALQPQLHAFLETPDAILVQLGLRDPSTLAQFPVEHSPAVRGDELIRQQQHYLVASAAVAGGTTVPAPRARA
jgi:hypothetical protein